ncbi:MAG: phospholipase D-like domain-containing protein [bacterium]|nr:phospholipase D-like domain-containing protein [bacterium]
MPLILDNIDQPLEAAMLETLATSRRLDCAVGYFNLRGWQLIAGAVDALPGGNGLPKVRLLVGMTENPADEMRRLVRARLELPVTNRVADEFRRSTLGEMRAQLQVGVPTLADERGLRTLRRQLAGGHVEVRLFLAHRLHAKLYLCHRDDTAAPRVAYLGSSNLTRAGLREQGELNTDVLDGDATAKLQTWFDARWDDQFSVPANPELVELLDESWVSPKPLEPYLVYLKMAYHLSAEAREGLIQYDLPALMRDRLLDFQAAAVKIGARIVSRRGGVIVGDVVGLGKTMIATAIARLLQENEGSEALIVCPKNLVRHWEAYHDEYRLHGRVISLSMVTKELADLRRHRLVIVDESHNLRSPKRQDHRALRSYIAANESKVVLLSATPYNKHLGDLDAQLSLFLRDDEDLGIRPERAIAEAGEAEFARLCEGRTATLAAFRRSSHMGDWQSLLSQFLLRRTRRFIQDNYARRDSTGRDYLMFGDGRRFHFPGREARPVERRIEPDDPAAAMISEETVTAVASLRLPRYDMARYLADAATPTAEERVVLDDLRHAANGNLRGFNRIMMFKRLSSSGPAFLATLRRHALRNLVALHAVENDLPVPVGSVDDALWVAEADAQVGDLFEAGLLEDGEATVVGASPVAGRAYERLIAARRAQVRWLRAELFNAEFAEALRGDAETLRVLLGRFGSWNPDLDGKIAELTSLVADRHAGEKVLVFTEAADTADYVAAELQRRGVVGVAAVTGESENPTALAHRFSPRSNRQLGGVETADELRVLVSTDVLSEGQNLQDSRIVVCYDLPWAIVKLVQRAGRVDRIGQSAEQVIVYSMFPADSVDNEIDLRRRIRRRLAENATLLGSDEEFFGNPDETATIRGLYDEHASQRLMASGPSEDVDPVSMAYEIWRHATENDVELAKRVDALPDVVYSTRRSGGEAGVVVHSVGVGGTDVFAFVPCDGDPRRILPQEALRMARCDPETVAERRFDDHHDMVASAFEGPLAVPPDGGTAALVGIRGRCWQRLQNHRAEIAPNLLFDADLLDEALGELCELPLQEGAKQRLAMAMRERTPEDLAALVAGLHSDGLLCVPLTDGARQGRQEPRVICSMGLRPA